MTYSNFLNMNSSGPDLVSITQLIRSSDHENDDTFTKM